MFNKTHKKHVFIRINSFYNLLEYLYNSIEKKYPIIDNDTQERDLLLNNFFNLMENLKKDIFSYKNGDITFDSLEYTFEKYKEKFDDLKSNFPVLSCFLVNPPFVTGDSVFPLTDILNYATTFPK